MQSFEPDIGVFARHSWFALNGGNSKGLETQNAQNAQNAQKDAESAPSIRELRPQAMK